MIYLLASIGVLALLALWVVPKLQIRSAKRSQTDGAITLADLLKAENDRRATLAQILGGLAILGTVYYNSKTADYNSKTVRLQENGQLTDRINKAVEQLGNVSPSVQLGGIHQLGRIATDSDEERLPILHILASHLEEKEKLDPPLQTRDCNPFRTEPINEASRHDSQAVIDVVKEQAGKLLGVDDIIEIDHTNLRIVDFSRMTFGKMELAGSDLTGAYFEGTRFANESQFQYSDFSFAHLSKAKLPYANLQQSCFVGADLKDAVLSGATLDSADFRAVGDLTGATFDGATLRGTNFRGVDLRKAKGFTARQMRHVMCNADTIFPDDTGTAEEFTSLAKDLKCGQIQAF